MIRNFILGVSIVMVFLLDFITIYNIYPVFWQSIWVSFVLSAVFHDKILLGVKRVLQDHI